MSKIWISLLCGGLAASLAVNVWCLSGAGRDVVVLPPATPGVAGDGEGELRLSAPQLDSLLDSTQQCCSIGDDLESSFRAKLGELRAELDRRLAGGAIDAERVERLAAEIGELSRRSVVNCVESILLVQDVLEPEQLRCLEQCYGLPTLIR